MAAVGDHPALLSVVCAIRSSVSSHHGEKNGARRTGEDAGGHVAELVEDGRRLILFPWFSIKSITSTRTR